MSNAPFVVGGGGRGQSIFTHFIKLFARPQPHILFMHGPYQ